MAPPQHSFGPLAFVLLVLVTTCHQVSALPQEYCSDINTSTNNKNSSIFQSNGLCFSFCETSYAFAILQNDGCWCSNYAPASNTSGCDTACPGYPNDLCGGDNLYGYIALFNTPSGTEGGSSPAPSTTTTPSTASGTLAKVTTTKPESSSTWTPTPVTSLETVTGEVRTVTVTPTAPPNSLSSTPVKKTSGGFGTGAAVGLTIGLVALLAIICSIVYVCWRKRTAESAEGAASGSRRGSNTGLGGAPTRTMSQNSRFILNTDGHRVVENWDNGDVPGSRRSRLIPVDPRLDPFSPVYQRGLSDNKSRESMNTIRDDHDYSRRVHQQAPILRATNPDDPEE